MIPLRVKLAHKIVSLLETFRSFIYSSHLKTFYIQIISDFFAHIWG